MAILFVLIGLVILWDVICTIHARKDSQELSEFVKDLHS